MASISVYQKAFMGIFTLTILTKHGELGSLMFANISGIYT